MLFIDRIDFRPYWKAAHSVDLSVDIDGDDKIFSEIVDTAFRSKGDTSGQPSLLF